MFITPLRFLREYFVAVTLPLNNQGLSDCAAT